MSWLILLVVVVAVDVASAESVVVERLDVIEVERPVSRELAIDPVESALAAGRELPATSALVAAGDDGWFLDDVLTGNYARAAVTVEASGVWLLEGMAYAGVYVNGEPRIGNVYGWKDDWQPWEPNFDFSSIPVALRAGENELLFFGIRFGRMRASLRRAESELVLNARDVTRPDLVVGQATDTVASIPVVNATDRAVDDAWIEAIDETGASSGRRRLATIAPLGVRKVAFPVIHAPIDVRGTAAFDVVIGRGDTVIDRIDLELDVKEAHENRRVTFTSAIDGSVQYFGLLPATGAPGPKALVLSLHGAAVEAINQSGSYGALDWAHVVAPTNRRPYGFDWENWGRLDALEVLDQATSRLEIDPDRIYLTGHSMGGHGTWHLATLHPDRFAAAGPSAGWITYTSYRRSPAVDESSPMQDMLTRATSTSQTLAKAKNLAALGLYVLHGAEDDNVPPEQSHLMLAELESFHTDVVYHEEPGAGHWWDHSEENGADCVAWAPMFDFFARHRRPSVNEVRFVDFRTPNPATSAWNHWAGILRQERVFEMSHVDLRLDPWAVRVSGTTSNVALLALDLAHLDADSVALDLDGQSMVVALDADGRVHLDNRDAWTAVVSVDPSMKGAHRNGGFRDAFTNRPTLVVGTQGSSEDTARNWAKARYDAEYLWYQGNASLAVVADVDFDPAAAPDHNVVLYGSADTHAHFDALVDDAIDVRDGTVRVGDHTIDAAAVLAIRPRPGSDVASVGIIAGSSAAAMRLTERRPILSGGYAYPDVTVLKDVGGTVVVGAGFFGDDWSVARGDFVWSGND